MKMHKGHYGKYTGNAKWSKDHAHTRVTKGNYKASERDDAAHIDYLKRDVLYDEKHGHSDEKMTADEKHISKLAGDMKYDKEHHGSPANYNYPKHKHEHLKNDPNMNKSHGSPARIKGSQKDHGYSNREFEEHEARVGTDGHGSPAKHNSISGRSHIHSRYHTSYEGDATFPKDKKKGGKVVKGDHGQSRFKKPETRKKITN